MDIQIEDAKELVQLAKVGIAALEKLAADGDLEVIRKGLGEIGKALCGFHSNFRQHCARLDVEQLRYYEDKGQLTRDQALYLLAVSKIAGREMLTVRKDKGR